MFIRVVISDCWPYIGYVDNKKGHLSQLFPFKYGLFI